MSFWQQENREKPVSFWQQENREKPVSFWQQENREISQCHFGSKKTGRLASVILAARKQGEASVILAARKRGD